MKKHLEEHGMAYGLYIILILANIPGVRGGHIVSGMAMGFIAGMLFVSILSNILIDSYRAALRNANNAMKESIEMVGEVLKSLEEVSVKAKSKKSARAVPSN